MKYFWIVGIPVLITAAIFFALWWLNPPPDMASPANAPARLLD